MSALPTGSGSYLLYLVLDRPIRLAAGRLPTAFFPAGVYYYAGSAFGPGGLRARVQRHITGSGPRRWHIDYLRPAARLLAVGFLTQADNPSNAARLECQWSQALAAFAGAIIPVHKFGASDCTHHCPAHLIAFAPGAAPLRPPQPNAPPAVGFTTIPSAAEIVWALVEAAPLEK
ncbi:MAG TPA: GIY-YIG nuclease family protein [Anaerolineales bacterium]|nr:GIY-YIG nuclease family protein [Anaerolineales bacterium]